MDLDTEQVPSAKAVADKEAMDMTESDSKKNEEPMALDDPKVEVQASDQMEVTDASPGTSSQGASGSESKLATVILVIGPAGSGKTRLTERLYRDLEEQGNAPYAMNLDPACLDPGYPCKLDIRDAVKYKNIMQKYNLGPNGAIVTCLNLYCTKFDQALDILKERAKTHKYILIDTPGQIEVFMWSASGNIITECLAALFPTVLLFVSDLVENQNPITFISNMTYACSILYKTRLPLIIALNKVDVQDSTLTEKWITDFEEFQNSLKDVEDYATNLASSLSLALDDFYSCVEHVAVSALDGQGIDKLFQRVEKSVVEYETVYRPLYLKMKHQREVSEAKKKRKAGEPNPLPDATCFSVPGSVDAGAGLSLCLDSDNDETSSEEEEPKALGDPDDGIDELSEDFRQVFNKEKKKRTDKSKVPEFDPTDPKA